MWHINCGDRTLEDAEVQNGFSVITIYEVYDMTVVNNRRRKLWQRQKNVSEWPT